MVVSIWQIRNSDTIFDPDIVYRNEPNFFSLKIHHGGHFTTNFPGRRYINGRVNFVDLIDGDLFSVLDLMEMVENLNYESDDIEVRYYHFKIPNSDLDYGLQALGNDDDVRSMIRYISSYKVIDVYVEHSVTSLDTYNRTPQKIMIEEIENDDMGDNVNKVTKKTSRRLALEWIADDLGVSSNEIIDDDDDDERVESENNERVESAERVENAERVEMGENVKRFTKKSCRRLAHDEDEENDEDVENTERVENAERVEMGENVKRFTKKSCRRLAHDEDEENDEDVENTERVGNDEDDDSEFIVDEEHVMNEVEVDMREFHLNVDKDVEWVETIPDANVQAPDDRDFMVGINLEDFDSATDSENEGQRNKALRKLRKEHAKKGKVDTNSTFYVGKEFGDRESIKQLVYKNAVESRRQLFIWKNDKERVRVICKGTCPELTTSENNQCENTSPLKKVGDKWVKITKGKQVAGGSNESGPNVIGPKVSGASTKGKQVAGRASTKKNSFTVKESISCPWTLHISKGKFEETWTVKTYMDVHKCIQTRKVNMCTNRYLAEDIEEAVKSNPDVPLKSLKEQIQTKFGIGVSVDKVFRAKGKATLKVKGDYTEQYNLLRDYCEELQRNNPNTTVKIETERCNPSEGTKQFKRIYVCLGVLKLGFKAGLRELLGVDGCHMRGPFPGQILTAVGVDPNHGTYPVAYAIVEAETKASWIWFLKCLGDDLQLERNSNFTFISDRQKGLLPALASVFPAAEHKFCLRHIHENMKLNWRGKLYKDLLWSCATATTVQYFEKAMDKFKNKNQAAYNWLKKIPPHHWSRAHFTGRAKCDVLLNNVCEVFNRQLLDGRDAPVITCLEFIREYLMRRIVTVQKVIDKSNGPLTPSATVMFDAIKEEANQYRVVFGGHKYQVSGPSDDQCVVDVANKNCTCRKWELTGMPCKHAVATIWDMEMNNLNPGSPESWVHESYWLSTWKNVYSYKINPINGRNMWLKSKCPSVLIPPKHRTQVGRPTKKRKMSAGELSEKMAKNGKLSRLGKTVTCDDCHQQGHNKRSCTRGDM